MALLTITAFRHYNFYGIIINYYHVQSQLIHDDIIYLGLEFKHITLPVISWKIIVEVNKFN